MKKIKDTTVETVTKAASTLGEYGTRSAGAVADAVAWSYGKSKSAGQQTASAATATVKRLDALGQGLLATELASNLNDMLAHLAKGAPTIYDKMMDAQYLETHVGGGLHRLFDGGHTLLGAFEAAKDAWPPTIRPRSWAACWAASRSCFVGRTERRGTLEKSWDGPDSPQSCPPTRSWES